MHTNILVDLQVLPDQLDLGIRILCHGRQTLLDALDLLRYCTKDSFFKSIELVKTTPSSDLAQADKYTTHRLKIKSFITAEHQNKSPKLDA
jgi:hypothetical protein